MEWLKGDFHAHTLRSDGVLTPAEFLKAAEREEMDFFAITELVAVTNPIFYGPVPGDDDLAYGSFSEESALELMAAFHEPSP